MEEHYPVVDVDKIQMKLFSSCKFQILTYLCLGVVYFRSAWHVFGILFLAADVDHTCSSDREVVQTANVFDGQSFEKNASTSFPNSTVSWSSTESKPDLVFRQCDVLVLYTNVSNMSMPCPFGWDYDGDRLSSIVSEWNLVCDRAYLSELSMTLYMVASMIGALLITGLADRFGRRLILLVSLVAQAVVGCCVVLAPNYLTFTALRFMVGFFNMGISLCMYVMMTETFPGKHRAIPSCGFPIFWALGIMVTALLGFLVRDWRHLQLIFCLPNIPCALLVWFLPETLPWLISQNKISQAQAVMKKVARFNGIDFPQDLSPVDCSPVRSVNSESHVDTTPNRGDQPLLEDMQTTDRNGFLSSAGTVQEYQNGGSELKCDFHKQNGLLGNGEISHRAGSLQDLTKCHHETEAHSLNSIKVDFKDDAEPKPHQGNSLILLCRTTWICLYSVILFYLFFVISLSYFGISLSIPVLHGNKYLNLFLLGAVEIPAYILCVFVCHKFGRKMPLCIFLLLCGFMNLAALILSKQTTSEIGVVIHIILVMLGKFAITFSYTIIYLYAAEIFPTFIRNCALGVSSCFENLGSVIAPFIVFWARSMTELPMILFGLVSIVGGLLVIMLPDTHNRPLPQTVEEVKAMRHCSCIKPCRKKGNV